MDVSKEKEVILRVLDMYQHMPFLWDKSHFEYKNKVTRANANRVLLQVYKKYDSTATVDTLKKKVQNLRTNYYKEARRCQEMKEKGVRYIPTLWYFDALSFLGEGEQNQPQDDLIIKKEHLSFSSSDEDESYENSRASETNSTPPAKKRKSTNPIVYKAKNIIKTQSKNQSISEKSSLKDEEWEICGKAIGLQLRDLDKDQAIIAQKMISDAIYYAKFNLLTYNSYIHTGTPPPQAPP